MNSFLKKIALKATGPEGGVSLRVPPSKSLGEERPKEPAKTPATVQPQKQVSFIKSNEIINMQNAIKAFSKEVTNYKTTPVIGPGGKVVNQPADSDEQKIKGPAGTTVNIDQGAGQDKQKDFNDFVTHNYLNKASVKGIEIYSGPLVEKWEDKIKPDYTDMNIMMNNLNHIGAGKFELKSDGAWGPRTNNALKTLYAFAESLVKIQSDFRVKMDPNFVFSDKDLSDFNSLLLKDEELKDPRFQQKKNENAKKLTPLIEKLTGFYKSYSNKVLQSPQYKPLIQGTQALHKIPLGGKDPAQFNAEDEDVMRDENKMKEKALRGILMSVRGSNWTVPEMNLVFLQTPELFANYIVRHLGYTQEQANDPKLQSQILNYILTHVDIVINQISSQLKAPPQGPLSQRHM